MLWDAEQKIVARESRDRRAELFEAVRDAQLAADISVGRVKPKGIYRAPAYLEPERGPDAARLGLRALVDRFGGTRVERSSGGEPFVRFADREQVVH